MEKDLQFCNLVQDFPMYFDSKQVENCKDWMNSYQNFVGHFEEKRKMIEENLQKRSNFMKRKILLRAG